MNVGLIVDATCDLPASLINRNDINIIPVPISSGTEQILDSRQTEATNLFYQNTSPAKIAQCEAFTPTLDSVLDFLKGTPIYHYDHLLLVAPLITTSHMLTRFREGVLTLQPELEALRQQAQLNKPLRIRVVESHSAYAGYGLVVYEALQLIHEKARNVDQIKKPLEHFVGDISTFVLPGRHASSYHLLGYPPFELSWLTLQKLKLTRTLPCFRVRKSGIKTVAEIRESAAENTFIELVYDELTRTTLTNHLVNVSFAGRLSQLRILPALKLLQAHVQDKGGRIVYSTMSPASASRLGAGAFSIAFA